MKRVEKCWIQGIGRCQAVQAQDAKLGEEGVLHWAVWLAGGNSGTLRRAALVLQTCLVRFKPFPLIP